MSWVPTTLKLVLCMSCTLCNIMIVIPLVPFVYMFCSVVGSLSTRRLQNVSQYFSNTVDCVHLQISPNVRDWQTHLHIYSVISARMLPHAPLHSILLKRLVYMSVWVTGTFKFRCSCFLRHATLSVITSFDILVPSICTFLFHWQWSLQW